ncbi:hypothetical protein DKX38_001604 [Salix brachista]|uniref:Pentacotripeptide-repeat region of PRORP domain-containing protein n=1 Tax=Salix brachista TaxID=2182728 RepID=A0A5N5P3M0_9ROSI|nr:hypothetical protein DKX38_001604 [Salix brachista]
MSTYLRINCRHLLSRIPIRGCSSCRGGPPPRVAVQDWSEEKNHLVWSGARQVFDEISERDVVSWTSMIDGYSKHNWCDEAVKLFDSMLMYSDVKPNEVTMIAVLSSCSQKRDLRLGKTFHEYVKTRNVTRSLNLMNAILDMYVKCGCLDSATEIFDTMGVRDVFSWTSMVNGYAKNGELEMARALFNEMPERNVVSWNAMIAGYSQNNQP